MARQSQDDRLKRWQERLKASNKVYDDWEKRFECARLERYYIGEQHRGVPENEAKLLYTINLIFPSIESQQSSLLFYRPKVKIEPKPPYGDDPGSRVAERAQLCQDTIQTFIDSTAVDFKLNTLLALRDAWFRFGLVEVGYSADWIDNPHAGKPVLKDSGDEFKDNDGAAIAQPDKVPAKEQLYIKHIRPEQFRVSLSGKNALAENDFIAYFDWQYVEDVKRNPKYKNTRDLKANAKLKDMETAEGDAAERERRIGMVKIWKVWDIRQKVKHVTAEGHDKFLIENEPWTYLPLAPLKFHELPRSWYPLPPVFNWMSPQDELNEGRNQRKNHRRRFNRRYIAEKGRWGANDEELEKLEKGDDGSIAMASGPLSMPPMLPVPDAPLGPDTDKALAETKDDFQMISGVSSEARGVAESDTATQANIIDVRARIRETSARVVVAEWLGVICRLMLACIREKMQLPFWIKQNADAANPAVMQEALRIQQLWTEINAEDLGDGEMEVAIDVVSLSPVSQDAQRQNWNQVLALITNPALQTIFAMSDTLLKKTLQYYGVTSAAEVQEIQNVLKMQAMMQAQMAMMAGGTGGAAPQAGPGPTQLAAGQPAAGGAPMLS